MDRPYKGGGGRGQRFDQTLAICMVFTLQRGRVQKAWKISLRMIWTTP
jgi:hypothetical protein